MDRVAVSALRPPRFDLTCHGCANLRKREKLLVSPRAPEGSAVNMQKIDFEVAKSIAPLDRTTMRPGPCWGKGRQRGSGGFLKEEDEIRLARAWRDDGDTAARNALIEAYIPFARGFALKMTRESSDRDDFINEAVIGLMAAADRFDPDKGYRFSTYAQWWVLSSLRDYRMRNHSLVRINSSGEQRKLFFSLRKVIADVERQFQQSGRSYTVADIHAAAADRLSIPLRAIEDFGGRLSGADPSLNARNDAADGEGGEWIDRIADDRPGAEALIVQQDTETRIGRVIAEALEILSPREREIIALRKLDPDDVRTLDELGHRFGVTRERVRQLEVSAMRKMRRFIRRSGFRVNEAIR
ncbi:sigma-70 family RNA polymerase sigma factor [Defluviimonas salinarum]|uniref:Sigma-70 family RNA polymerase sigma factor n=1 Tax=Defluviimonas salinarum TaxID=2992147 RepID=A0ABT3J489_9RHOB|nr:sigma-70 family RNA polymerase sigma factor [Defluviimonas salinarum]MCW3782504.1 sigma-70 family RNA polymerase sigma factor [Defluviimonas salinarum]